MFRTNPPSFENTFQSLHAEFSSFVFNLARKILKNQHDAEDITQAVFLKLWQTDIATIQRPQQWLGTVTVNLCTDLVRHNQRSKAAPLPDSYCLADSTRNDVTSREATHAVREAIGKLPDWQQGTVREYYLAEKTTRIVAQEMSLPEGTVKTRLHKARRCLAAYLAEYCAH